MKTQVIEIAKAKYLSEYRLELLFSDGIKRIVDFEQFLFKAQNPMTTRFRDYKKFKQFKILYGDLLWGDYEMCFPIADLYEGRI